LIIRGRRRIGKSALVEEFIDRHQAPSVFYTAEIGFGGEPLREFSEAVRASALPEAQSPNRSAGAFLPPSVTVGLVIRSMTGLSAARVARSAQDSRGDLTWRWSTAT
jgi:AAA+ ATPase superfamily predicted ATPase